LDITYLLSTYEKIQASHTQGGHTEVDQLINREKDSDYLIEVGEGLTNPHRLIDRTAKSLRGAKANDHHIVCPRAKHCLDVEVTKNSIDRAMCIMDALFKALEVRGYEVFIDDEKGLTKVTVLGENVEIHLEECIQRVSHVLTPQEEKRKARDYYYSYQIPDFDYHPTGKLTLSIRGRFLYRCGLRRSWSDAKVQRLDKCLNSIMVGLIKAASCIKANRLEDERREKAWAEEQCRREELREKREKEQARLDQFLHKPRIG